MFVANHASWNDIPYIGVTIGWKNYKFVGKKELLKVPILGSAISVAGHIALDRKDRASGLQAVKKGINWLKNGIHLITFPEGTRSRDGRLLRFKNGAFKMAVKAGAPVVPISIVNAHKVMPPDWMMPYRSSRGIAKVIVHDPVETEGKTEHDVAEEVRKAIISGLPPEQQPAV
jgi:1-acyl-sn-glycerol-3-phosphate acyltransferase